MKKTIVKRTLNWVCAILLLAILIGVGIGFYFRINDQIPLGDKFIGLSILAFTFVLLPIFLVHRWRGKKLEDYTLTKENMQRMREKGID